MIVAVTAILAACSGSGGDATAPNRPLPTIRLAAPVGTGINLAPPPLGGAPAQPPGGAAGSGAVPDWVRPGVRLSWYAAAASVAQSRYAWVEDPSGPWEDPKTGKHYRRTDEVGGEGQPGASGDGISQIDILAVEGPDVVLTSNLYGFDRSTGQQRFTWAPGPGAKVSGRIVDGAWVHPAVLAQLLGQDIGGLLILRGPYAVAGKTYSAISFVANSGSAYTSYTYDLETGILLAATTSTAGATSPFSAPGENAPIGNTQLTITRFLGVRDRGLPGTGAENPSWIARGGMLSYAGSYAWTNPVDPSSGAAQFPMQYQVTFGQGGRTWLPYTTHSVVQGALGEQPSQSSVAGATGRFWWDAAALTAMQQGQVLDRDPITGEEVVVAAVGPGGRGTIVTIDDAIPGVFQRASYDASGGQMLAYDIQVASSGTSVHLEWQAGP